MVQSIVTKREKQKWYRTVSFFPRANGEELLFVSLKTVEQTTHTHTRMIQTMKYPPLSIKRAIAACGQ